MPVISWGHSKYWRARPNPVVEPPPSFGGYPLWQSSIIIGSLFGVLQAWWDRVKYAYRWYRAAWSWSADQRRAFQEVARILDSPAWPAAQAAVFATSRAERFNEYQEWAKLGNALRNHHGWAENTWRHLHAVYEIEQHCSPMSNPDRNLLVELAYHEFAASGRGKPPRIP